MRVTEVIGNGTVR